MILTGCREESTSKSVRGWLFYSFCSLLLRITATVTLGYVWSPSAEQRQKKWRTTGWKVLEDMEMLLTLLFSLFQWLNPHKDLVTSGPISKEILLFMYAWQICKLCSKLIAECAEGTSLTRSWRPASFLKPDQYKRLLSLFNDMGVKSKLHLDITRAFRVNQMGVLLGRGHHSALQIYSHISTDPGKGRKGYGLAFWGAPQTVRH